MGKCKILLLLIILIFTFGLAGCAPKGDPTKVLNNYYDSIKSQNAENAYADLCEESKKDFNKSDFSKWLDVQSQVEILKNTKITKLNEYQNKKIGDTTYKNAVEFNIIENEHSNYDNKDAPVNYKRYVVNDNGQWKIYREKENSKETLLKAMNCLAWMYIDGKGKDKDYNQAASILNEAVKIYSKYNDIYYSLAYVYGALQRYDESIEAANKYLQSANDNKEKSDGYNVLGLDYESKKDYEKAKKYFDQAVQLNSNNQYAKTNLEQLNQLNSLLN
jgi:tetratricopeptide (TPR) repeat protein